MTEEDTLMELLDILFLEHLNTLWHSDIVK